MTDNRNNNLKLPIKINPYIIIVIILVLVIIITLSGRRNFEDTYDTYIKAVMECDANAVVDLLPEDYISNLIENEEIKDKNDLIQRVQNRLDWYSTCAANRGGDSYEYIAELQNITDVSEDNLPPYHLKYIYGDSSKKIKEAKTVTIYYTVYSYNERLGIEVEDTIDTESIYFVKIGQNWYLGEISDYYQFNW